ncbi:MAG: hypothetical protein CVU16_04915 [Betaproteobacteria bacterium HGW-Betaproteobacteria-10]|nr:MAG: hypothetical protein CVU16_04915 [Betaproteobacteria bacterium HGW-Betaproteobacteria-10]
MLGFRGLMALLSSKLKRRQSAFATLKGNLLAKPNYQFEKRQKDLAKKSKQEEKRQQKLAKKAADESDQSTETPNSSSVGEATPDA